MDSSLPTKLTCFLLFLGTLFPDAKAAEPVRRSFAMPIYGSGSHPVALLRIGAISRTHEKRGFFRLGLLPKARLEGVAIELIPGSDTKDQFRVIRSGLKRFGATSGWNAVGFQWGWRGKRPLLLAERVRPEGNEWRLEAAQFWLGGHRIRLAQARLRSSVNGAELIFENHRIPIADLSRNPEPIRKKHP